ncbi:MAG: hypothetical protein JWL65_1421 [Gammaproteobacteria bacterium]|nr:hypothetical protein [Gammaproteobacteria bacterium]
MYLRITLGRTKPGHWSALESAYLQHIESHPARGLVARWLVRSTSELDVFFTLSLWDSVAAMEAYERSDAVRRQVLHHIAPHLSGVSTAHHCQFRGDLPLEPEQLAALFAAPAAATST